MANVADTTFKTKYLLYHQDTRAPGRKTYNICELKFGNVQEEVASRIHELIYCYFQVNDQWDKKLFDSMFLGDLAFNSFEFERNRSSVIYGVKIWGQRGAFLMRNWPGKLELTEKDYCLLVSVRGSYNEECILNYKSIKEEYSDDLAIVALYNSSTFSGFKEGITGSPASRIIRKIRPDAKL